MKVSIPLSLAITKLNTKHSDIPADYFHAVCIRSLTHYWIETIPSDIVIWFLVNL